MGKEMRAALVLASVALVIFAADISKTLGQSAAMVFMGVAGLALYLAIHHRR